MATHARAVERLGQTTPFDVTAGVTQSSAAVVWGMLLARSVVALGTQVAVAALAWSGGAADPWRTAADWWLGSLVLVNVATIVLLRAVLRRENRRLRDLFRIRRADVRGDLPWVFVALLFAGPMAMIPSIAVSQLLWGSVEAGSDLIVRALPVVAALAIVLVFPVLQAIAELPTYFGFVMPRLEALYGWRLRALLTVALVLSAQHIFMPLLLDWRAIIWRGIVFLPLALWLGYALLRRPTALPYLAAAQGLIDASLPLMVLLASLE